VFEDLFSEPVLEAELGECVLVDLLFKFHGDDFVEIFSDGIVIDLTDDLFIEIELRMKYGPISL